MKTPSASLRLGLVATVALLTAAAAPAQSVVTDPVGFTTLTVTRPNTSSRSFTYLSLNMFRPTAFRSVVPTGGVSAAGSNTTLTFAANSFTANQFAGTGNAHFLEITNGTSAGVLADIVSNTTNTITLNEDVAQYLAAGTSTIKVRPHWTFSTAFGATNSAGFLAGTASTGDTVSLINPANGAYTIYYFSATNNRWQTGLSTDASGVTIPEGTAIVVFRRPGNGSFSWFVPQPAMNL